MIFISYSREDRAFAERITRKLSSAGRLILHDPPLVQGDAFWRRRVRDMIAESHTMLVLWSRSAAASPWVDQEIRAFQIKAQFLKLDSTPLPRVWCEHRPEADSVPVGGTMQQHEDDASDTAKRRAECLRSESAALTKFRAAVRGRAAPVTIGADGISRAADGNRLIHVSTTEKDGFYLAATPVTNGQYRTFVEETEYAHVPTWGEAAFRVIDAPVVGVTWFEAMAYAAWIGGDLPTREEWQLAATSGDPTCQYATADGCLSPDLAHYDAPFGTGAPCVNSAFGPSRRGFYGMSGNTWDWCSTADGMHRAICGGGYMDSASFCRVTATYRNAPIDRDCCVGFRVRVTVNSNGDAQQ